jgi:hypothetical protein
MSSITVSTTMNKALIAFSRELLEDTITAIANKHGLDVSETLREFMPAEFVMPEKQAKRQVEKKVIENNKYEITEDVNKSEKPKKKPEQPKFVLPWCGEAKDCWCSGIRANYGLYTQCTMPRLPGEKYCKTCAKHAEANSEGIPPCGTVEQRLAAPLLEYRDPKGKKASLYTAYMKKNNLSPEMVIQEAAKFGLTVPEEQLNTVSSGRGRPKKSTIIDDSASDSTSHSTDNKPGRPKKSTTHEPDSQDLIAAAMASNLHIDTTFTTDHSPTHNSFLKIPLTPLSP